MTAPHINGLREAHAHLFQHGRSIEMVDLSSCSSAGEVIHLLVERARAHDNEPILAHGARPDGWEEPIWPTIAQLDAVSTTQPIIAWCFDYHALVGNTIALSAAGFDHDSPNPLGGIVGRDKAGALTGVVYERAALAVWDAVPEPAEVLRMQMLRAGVTDLVERHGFVEIHDLKAQTWLGPSLAAIAATYRGRVRFRLWPLVTDLAEVYTSHQAWATDEVALGGGKIFVDGTLNSRTAWMLHPYADSQPDHPYGTPMMSASAIEDSIRQCDELGLPIAAHAIGDAAVRSVLDAIERVGPQARGHRIEHCEVIDADDVPRFAELGVIASVQPCHLLYDIEALRRGLPDRLDRVMPLRSLIDAGLIPGEGLIFGSDVPIVRPDPADSVRGAVHRRRETHKPEAAIGKDQALTEDEAWACFGVASSTR